MSADGCWAGPSGGKAPSLVRQGPRGGWGRCWCSWDGPALGSARPLPSRIPRTLGAWRRVRGLTGQRLKPLTAAAAPPPSSTQRHPEAGTLQEPHRPQRLQPRREPHAHPTVQDAPAEGEGCEGGHRPHAAPGWPGAPSPRLRGFCLSAAPGHLRAGCGWCRPGGQEAQEGPGCVLGRLCPRAASSPETGPAAP